MGIFKTIIVLLVGLTLASVHVVEAQQPTKMARMTHWRSS